MVYALRARKSSRRLGVIEVGGRGDGKGLTPAEQERLEEMARGALREAAQSGRRNVFLSFATEDLGEVNLLRGQAKKDGSDIAFNDWSVKEPFDSEEAEYIRRGIRERIRQCSVTIVYVSESTSKSKWVDWEIREALRLGKGVVAMHKGDAPPRSLPHAISEHRIPIVPWNQEQLSRAIDRAAAE